MPARVIINEQHSLNPTQGRVLEERFVTYSFVGIPATGLSRDDQELLSEELCKSVDPVVFVSPVPLLLAIMAGRCGRAVAARDIDAHPSGMPPVFLFHNDTRVKTEHADGRITSILSPDGWELILL